MTASKAKQLGVYIKRARERKGLSLRALARDARVNAVTILEIERGDYKSPDPQKLLRIARALEVPIEDLYAYAGYTMPEGLPQFRPYLRVKYDLPEVAIEEMDKYFADLKERYGGEGVRRGKQRRR